MIGFKHGKDVALNTIEDVVRRSVYDSAYKITGMPLNMALGDIIAEAVRAAMEELLRQQYTHDDLETDLKLNT